jgi:hypothetical protein
LRASEEAQRTSRWSIEDRAPWRRESACSRCETPRTTLLEHFCLLLRLPHSHSFPNCCTRSTSHRSTIVISARYRISVSVLCPKSYSPLRASNSSQPLSRPRSPRLTYPDETALTEYSPWGSLLQHEGQRPPQHPLYISRPLHNRIHCVARAWPAGEETGWFDPKAK